MVDVNIVWQKVCSLSDIPERGSRVLKTEGDPIALFRAHDDKVFALVDKCPHKGGPLSQGIVHGHAVTCPLHNWDIALETGEAITEKGCTKNFKVKIEGDQVFIALPETIANG